MLWRWLVFGFSFGCAIYAPAAVAAAGGAIIQVVKQAEFELDARIGVAIHDTGSNVRWHYNAHDRFPMVSTFKVLACGALLARVDAGKEDGNRQISIDSSDLVTYSPVTEK